MVGHDGGVDFSYDGGKTWKFIDDWMPIGQFYEVAVDMRRPYDVYGGAQDEGAWGGPSRVRNDGGITKSHWFEMMSGDAWHVDVDPSDWSIVYIEDSVNAGGHTWRVNLKTGEQTYVRPTGGREPNGQTLKQTVVPLLPPTEVVRFNWNSPFIISAHNPQVLYFGGSRLFKLYNRGDTWTATKDLTKVLNRNTFAIMGVAGTEPMVAKNDGVGVYGTITAISESSIVPGVLWVGTDAQSSGIERRWNDVDERQRERGKVRRQLPSQLRRCVARRRRNRVRGLRRSSLRRLPTTLIQDDGLRKDMEGDLDRPAPARAHQCSVTRRPYES